ncbi:kinase [Micromonospora rosaria]|uniref:kinase n=1 Tax=Micromonospora rosaria TaxID=47874 RepID=UPI0037CCAF11
MLYGPPASGKDTVTRELVAMQQGFLLFPRVKAGAGRTDGYRMVSSRHFEELRRHGELIWENERYRSRYGIDRSGLIESASKGLPVLHLGQVAAIDAVRLSVPSIEWLVVSLWCPRNVAAIRIAERNTGDDNLRLSAWDETESISFADLAFNTAVVKPDEVAAAIAARAVAR